MIKTIRNHPTLFLKFIVIWAVCSTFLAFTYLWSIEEVREFTKSLADPEFSKAFDRLQPELQKLKKNRQWAEAKDLLEQNIEKFGPKPGLYSEMGGLYYDQKNYLKAAEWWNKTVQLDSTVSRYWDNLSTAYDKSGRPAMAGLAAAQSYAIRPTTGKLSSILMLYRKSGNYEHYEEELNQLKKMIQSEISEWERTDKQFRKVSPLNVWTAIHYPFTPLQQFRIAQSHGLHDINMQSTVVKNFSDYDRTNVIRPEMKDLKDMSELGLTPEKRIRVGFSSPDLRTHAVGVQIRDMFQYFDRKKFEIFCYDVHPDASTDGVSTAIKKSVDHWRSFSGQSQAAMATQIFNDQLDILIDLALYTAYNQIRLLSLKLAPIQVVWLGLASTSGNEKIDYIIGDRVATPLEDEEYFTEKIVFMPGSYHVANHRLSVGKIERQDHDLPELEKYPVWLCNYGGIQKIEPHVFDIWLNILQKAPETALILKFFNQDQADNLLSLAKAHHIAPDRVEFHQPYNPHIPTKSRCDIALDTHNYNGHSGTLDILYAGVPLVTFPAGHMSGRVAASALTTIGVPELITDSFEAYEDLVVRLAKDEVWREELRRRVEKGREESLLYDVPKFVQSLEKGFEKMYDNLRQGNPPQHIFIESK